MFFELLLSAILLFVVFRMGRGNRREIAALSRRLAELERELRETRAPAAPTTAPPTAATQGTSHARDGSALERLEQTIGGVWLQNLGAVLLLAGVFFLIVWGWTTGRFGPEVPVVAGVVVGAVLVWRGDRLRRSLPGLGHAFIGLGFGVAYVTLFLGYFTLRALPAPLAIAALIGVSALSLLAGLHYRVQTIAALGVIGAFLPQLLPDLLHLPGFALSAGALLGWIAAVGALVFSLTARAGWSALDLSTLLLAAFTWLATHPQGEWGWPITLGLAATFAALGVAPLPRLLRVAGRVRPVDLAVVAVAPLGFLAAAWPALLTAGSRPVAMLLLGMAALYAGAAAWVDARRPERDLWRPLTGAATIFLTVALERALGADSTPVAWTVEGAVLLALGLGPRSGWLRLCGGVVLAIGALWGFVVLVGSRPADGKPFSPVAIRTLVILAAVLISSQLLARRRDRLTRGERRVPEFLAGIGHLLLAVWLADQAGAVAHAIEGPAGIWQRVPSLVQPPADVRASGLAVALDACAWSLQAAFLAMSGVHTRRLALRGLAIALLGVSVIAALLALLGFDDPWSSDWLPILHPPGILLLLAGVVAACTAAWMGGRRESLDEFDRNAPEVWGFAAGIVLMAWTAREADHVVRAMLGLPGPRGRALGVIAAETYARRTALAPVFTSVGWLLQALATTTLGWVRRSAFLRWTGLALVGLTALKFVSVDLAAADPFWRFLSAIAAGVAMLLISWGYQRKKRAAVAARSGQAV